MMQLRSQGGQNIFLIGNPSITFFKTVYRYKRLSASVSRLRTADSPLALFFVRAPMTIRMTKPVEDILCAEAKVSNFIIIQYHSISYQFILSRVFWLVR